MPAARRVRRLGSIGLRRRLAETLSAILLAQQQAQQRARAHSVKREPAKQLRRKRQMSAPRRPNRLGSQTRRKCVLNNLRRVQDALTDCGSSTDPVMKCRIQHLQSQKKE